jgi:hypothetical protein
MPCTAPMITLLEAFRPLFTAPTWNKMLTLLRGTLLARGRRTVPNDKGSLSTLHA